MNKPSFLCIGAAKSGTTSLHALLDRNPNIYLPNAKETHFFSKTENFNRGIEWYTDTFYSKCNYSIQIAGEVCPTYLSSPDAPERIFRSLGKDTRFIIVLRDPVQRAFSHYLHLKRLGKECRTFLQALRDESETATIDKIGYISDGLYMKSYNNYLKFFDSDNFIFISFDNLIQNKVDMEVLYRHLGASGDSLDETQKQLPHLNAKGQPKLKWLSKLVFGGGSINKLAKSLIPSEYRIKLRGPLERLLEKGGCDEKLSQEDTKIAFHNYFMDDWSRISESKITIL